MFFEDTLSHSSQSPPIMTGKHKVPRQAKEELQQYLDNDRDIQAVHDAILNFILDEHYPHRRTMSWGATPNQARDVMKREFLLFVQQTLIPQFLTVEMKQRNPNLNLFQDLNDTERILNEHKYFRLAMTELTKRQRKNGRHRPDKVELPPR